MRNQFSPVLRRSPNKTKKTFWHFCSEKCLRIGAIFSQQFCFDFLRSVNILIIFDQKLCSDFFQTDFRADCVCVRKKKSSKDRPYKGLFGFWKNMKFRLWVSFHGYPISRIWRMAKRSPRFWSQVGKQNFPPQKQRVYPPFRHNLRRGDRRYWLGIKNGCISLQRFPAFGFHH